jgi:PAS domain S-box-containing protein
LSDPQTYTEVIAIQELPVVAIDHNSLFTMVNKAFEHEYGWRESELLGKSVTEIIPPYLRDAHQIGFSRFLTTEEVTLLGKRLPLGILYKNGTVQDAEHYILGEKYKKQWRFAAIITPRS